jgi:penicillin-binding protein 2
MRCTKVHGYVDMHRAMVQSCNVYFWHIAEQIGLDRLNRYATAFGLGERTGIGINSEARGFLASRAWYEENYGRYRMGYTLNTSIGQGNTRVTLVQLALAYAAMANGGTLYAPQLIERIETPDGRIIEELTPQVRRRLDLPPSALAYNHESLVGVVNHPDGTAFNARIEGGVIIAGKTGTAQVAPGIMRPGVDPRRAWYFSQSHAWFTGYAPADNPTVAIVVLIEHGGAGGRNAAPIAIRMLEDYLGQRPAAGTTPATTPAATTPPRRPQPQRPRTGGR